MQANAALMPLSICVMMPMKSLTASQKCSPTEQPSLQIKFDKEQLVAITIRDLIPWSLAACHSFLHRRQVDACAPVVASARSGKLCSSAWAVAASLGHLRNAYRSDFRR